MSNCDWGRPCTCVECRTMNDSFKCPKCGFLNSTETLGDSHFSVDHKGVGGYTFNKPNMIPKSLNCYKCGYLIKNIKYGQINLEICKYTLDKEKMIESGRVCSICKKIEKFDYLKYSFNKVELKIKNNILICKDCYSDIIKKQSIDPTNKNEKYRFNNKTMKWEIYKIRRICIKCKKSAWINIENSWKTQCTKCYKS